MDLSRAASAPGVACVLSGADLLQLLPPVPDTQLSLPRKWTTLVQHKFINPQQPLLAHDKVRHVGEAVAVIVAHSRYAAEDAAQLVTLDLNPLPAVVDPELALRPGAPIIHDKFQTNLIGAFTIGKGDIAAAFARSPHKLQRRFHHHRYAAAPMECRGVVGVHDPRTDCVTIWSATQVVHWVRREAAAVLQLPEARIRCVALDVGGGFGVKGHVYPEDLLIPFLARRLERPVQWIEDRREHLMCSCHSRDQMHDVEVGFDDEGRILALRDQFIVDCGAWNPIGAGVVYNTAVHLLGPYKIDAVAIDARIAATNKVPNAPYRGAGRPEAAFAMERIVDLVAGELGLEPAEVRLRNMIRADEMPYRVGMPYRDGEPIVYDGGDYPRALRQALDAIGGVAAFRQRQRAARHEGRYLGLGIGCYVEGTGVGPFESAMVRIDPSGKIFVSSGACPQGQGMETIFAQVVADAWCVDPADVVMSLADTAAIAIGFGTIASRSTVTFRRPFTVRANDSHHGQRHVPHALPPVGAVDRGRLVELLGNRFQRRQIHDHKERRADPDIDQNDGKARPIGVSGPGNRADAELVQDPVERAVGRIEQPQPGETAHRRRDHPGHQQHAAPLALASARDVVHEVRDDEADERFEDDGSDGEDAGLPHHHPERLALEQEQEIAEADEALHRLVQRGEMDGVERGIEDEERHQQDERKRHQKRDGRFAPHGLAQREAPARPRGHRRSLQRRLDHAQAPNVGRNSSCELGVLPLPPNSGLLEFGTLKSAEVG